MEHQADYDVVIIGSGVTGTGASIYCGRFGLKTVVIGEKPGGTIILTDDIANYPGFIKISGMDLADKIHEHAVSNNIEFVEKKVTKVAKCSEGCFKVFVNEDMYHTKTVIYATGTEWRKLGIPGEKEFTSRGVHYCALCDGPVYKDKVVGIIGGSDSAAKEALLMAEYASQVYLFVRGDKLRAEPINNQKVIENKKITIFNNIGVLEVFGEKFVNAIKIDKQINNLDVFNLDAIFVNIGHIPVVSLAKEIGVLINSKNEIIIDRMSKTNISGFYAAGDVADTQFKQAITGVAEGVTAAYSAYHYINENEFICLHNDEGVKLEEN
jgi:thioredoxin-disulfide reductase